MGDVERVEPAAKLGPAMFPVERFDLNSRSGAVIAAGKANADSVIAKACTIGTLTPEQIDAIRAPVEQPVTDVQPKGEPRVMLEKTVGDQLHAAATLLDALYEAADLIGEVADPEARARLTQFFEERQFALEGVTLSS